MMNIILFLLTTLAIIHLWNCSKLFSPIRYLIKKYSPIKRPFLCCKCNSIWFGMGNSLIWNPIGSILVSGLVVYALTVFLCNCTKFFKEEKPLLFSKKS